MSLSGHTEEDVNEVNAPAHRRGARHRGRRDQAVERARLHRPRAGHRDRRRGAACASPGRLVGKRFRPHLLEAWGQRFDLPLEDHITLFRYRDVPGMIGRVGTVFGATASTSSRPPSGASRTTTCLDAEPLAAMMITTDRPVPPEVVSEIVGGDGFVAGRSVSL